jgi:hypothetical protein
LTLKNPFILTSECIYSFLNSHYNQNNIRWPVFSKDVVFSCKLGAAVLCYLDEFQSTHHLGLDGLFWGELYLYNKTE